MSREERDRFFQREYLIRDVIFAYLKIISKSRIEGNDSWNKSVDELLKRYESDSALLKSDAIKYWNNNPEEIYHLMNDDKIVSTKTLIVNSGLNSTIGKLEKWIENLLDNQELCVDPLEEISKKIMKGESVGGIKSGFF